MMGMLWVVLFVALTGLQSAYGLPLRPTPQTYPHDPNAPPLVGWGGDSGLYAALPALVLVITAVGLMFGCTWCYRHKDCKLFTASATHLHESRRSQPPDSGFSEPANNNISEDNNNGPISLREMQNIANNNAAAYIVSENEERNRVSRESVVEFEPLPLGIRVADPLEQCADWFGGEDFPRNHLQYLREIGRGWFGRVVEGELENAGSSSTIAVKILNQNASLEDKARFLNESRLYRDARHENVLAYVAKCLQEDPWMLIFEFCPTDLQQYLVVNRPKMAILNESGVPLRLMCDVTSALAYLHSRGYLYGNLWSGNVLVRGHLEDARAVLGRYAANEPPHQHSAPESSRHPPVYTTSSEVWSLGGLVWEVCAWGAPAPHHPPPMPDLPCPYRSHLYQVMQLCWNQNSEARPTAGQVHALINHLHSTHTQPNETKPETTSGTSDFEERWQRLKPNTIPKIDEHVAIIHAPSTSTQHFSSSDQEFDHSHTIQDSLSVDLDTAVSRSSSIMSDKEPLSIQIKSESLTNLHGSLEDVRNIYLTHNEMAALECHQGNIGLEDTKEKEHDKSDSSVDPWLKDIIAGSQDDVSYYKDVSDVIKNLDNILNSEKTSSSESSHQASPSRDNLSLDCKKDYPMQSNMVKSPGITNFQNILETGFNTEEDIETCEEDEGDRDTIGTLSHSFERHSDTVSQKTLENLTPETPIMDFTNSELETREENGIKDCVVDETKCPYNSDLPKVNSVMYSDSKIPELKKLCVASMPSLSENMNVSEDCQSSCDNIKRTDKETKSIDDKRNTNFPHENVSEIDFIGKVGLENIRHILPKEISKFEPNIEGFETGSVNAISHVTVENSILKPEQNKTAKCSKELVSTCTEKINDLTANLIENSSDFKKKEVEKIFSEELYDNIENEVNFPLTIEKDESKTHDQHLFSSDSNVCEDFHKELALCVTLENTLINKEKMLNEEEITKKTGPCDEIASSLPHNDELLDIKSAYILQNIIEESTDKSDVILSNQNVLIDNTIDTVEIVPKESQVYKEFVNVGAEKSKGIIESYVFLEFERNNIINEAIIRKPDVISTTEPFKGVVDILISDNKHPECSQMRDNATDEIVKINDSDFSAFCEDKEILDVSNFQKSFINASLGDKKEIDSLKKTDPKLIEDIRELTCSESTTVNILPDSKVEVMVDSNRITELIEVPFQDLPRSPRSPNPSNISKQDTPYLCNQEDNTANKILEHGTEDRQIQLELNQNLSEALEKDLKPVDIFPKVLNMIHTQEDCDISKNCFSKNYERVSDNFDHVADVLSHHTIENNLNNIKENDSTQFYEKPEIVQNSDKFVEINKATNAEESIIKSPEIVQNSDKRCKEKSKEGSNLTIEINKDGMKNRSESLLCESMKNFTDSTVYMDLTNDTFVESLKDKQLHNKENRATISMDSCLELPDIDHTRSVDKYESTEYMDLPSVEEMSKDNTLYLEKLFSSKNLENVVSSTPISSDTSRENVDKTLENHSKVNETACENGALSNGTGATVTKLEQKFVPDSTSPFESPTRSHHTDTYDENSSVVLGPFENCTLELFKTVKTHDLTDLPREEVLAFSSNFSEINLATPSPLRDGNFLNEVPDIVHEDCQFYEVNSICDDVKLVPSTHTGDVVHNSGSRSSENSEDTLSETQKHISPSTPPNSPGIFLASSQEKYLVDIDLNLNGPVPEPSSSCQQKIELNQIQLQINTKLTIMAENENNMNIEYSGPLIVEGLREERNDGDLQESYVSENRGSVEDIREGLALDECVKALRNELELKLPLAQVAGIEPALGEVGVGVGEEGEWSGELPPPPELVVSYPGALSPIAEETRQQLNAYENDANWTASIRTDSSESYPEPCNNSTDEVTELPTGAHTHSTYTIDSKEQMFNNTYTIQKDVSSSKETTMSVDSLNASLYKRIKDDTGSAIDDTTYIKDDCEKESNCERLSQVSPFLISPTTDTSVPENSENFDNATGVSTLSKTTLPTDAKLSKPTECLSKATSIDSWCSNDTLYNVEENFDDMAVEPEPPMEFEDGAPLKDEGNSESTDTLTHNEHEKEVSNGSTHIRNDSKSELCESFSGDSMTANDYNTYTKAKTEATGITLSIIKSESKNSPTKDLAYGTLMSGMPSYSNCTTEFASAFDDMQKCQQPELMRRSPVPDRNVMSPPRFTDEKVNESQLNKIIPSKFEPSLITQSSLEISVQDNSDQHSKSENSDYHLHLEDVHTSPPISNYHMHMMPSKTSTPLTNLYESEDVQPIPMQLPEIKHSPEAVEKVPDFQHFFESAEIRPQDLSSYKHGEFITSQASEILLEGESNMLSRNSKRDSLAVSAEQTTTYTDFENSAMTKPQDMSSTNRSKSLGSENDSDGFRRFENSARSVPQDLSSLDSSMLLRHERNLSEKTPQTVCSSLNLSNCTNNQHVQKYCSVVSDEPVQIQPITPPININSNLVESQKLVSAEHINNSFLINFVREDETEQPHSIIITETILDRFRDTPDDTLHSHSESKLIDITDQNCTYDSHLSRYLKNDTNKSLESQINGEVEIKSSNKMSPKPDNLENTTESVKIERNSTHENIQSVLPVVSDDLPLEIKVAPNCSFKEEKPVEVDIAQRNGGGQKYAIVNFLSENFEELLESNVDDGETKDTKLDNLDERGLDDNSPDFECLHESHIENSPKSIREEIEEVVDGFSNGIVEARKMTTAAEDFLQNEKRHCMFEYGCPSLLSDIRFTGPAAEIMSTSFSQEPATAPTSPECEQDNKPKTETDIPKEWDSDSDTQSTNSSSGEFIWKDGDGHETSVVPSTRFEHKRGSGGSTSNSGGGGANSAGGAVFSGSGSASASASGSGSEGDEVEFVPSSWDCRAAPSKSSLRSLEQTPPDSKKRVVFKRQKYHCVYEYPKEVADVDAYASGTYLPDRSTYSEWDPRNAEEAEIGYGQLYGTSSPHELHAMRPTIALGADYDEDFFISSSARPFESLGIMSTSQFFPGMHMKEALMRDLPDDVTDEFPPPPSPLAATGATVATLAPSLDFTTPDSGVEDITPGSTADEDFKRRLPESELTWRPLDSASSSESVSPSSPGGEALGGLRHTRDKLKLDLPPSPRVPSPRHSRVFNFVLDKPKRRSQASEGSTPLVMTDDTPIVSTSLPLQKDCDDQPAPEPTFSTFGKSVQKVEPEQKIILTDEVDEEVKEESPKVVEAVKGEGTVLDSGDEDSGIESSSKATLERNKTSNVS